MALPDWLEHQRPHLALWAPVCFGAGCAGYFTGAEPGLSLWVAVAGAMAVAAVVSLWLRYPARLPSLAALLLLGGYVYAALWVHVNAKPMLSRSYYGGLEGRVADLGRSSSGAPRLLLEDVRLYQRFSLDHAQLSLAGDAAARLPQPGMRIMMTAYLNPPPPSSEPDGFDYPRYAFLRGIGGVGYARAPWVLHPQSRGPGFLQRLRIGIEARIRAQLPPDQAAIAVALITGARSDLPLHLVEDLRRANLAHLLAISGLHMGLITGVGFLVIRIGLSLWPRLALRLPVKKIAAVIATALGFGYLLLSGASVSTQRAFIMVAVVLIAVLVDRPAFTLRAVALAALIVLLVHPGAIIEPGFQMSFAATAALVATFRAEILRPMLKVPVLGNVAALVLSSLIAGAATAPFAVFHFNQLAHYGVLANLLSLPVMGTVVMPAGLLAVVLMPFGLEAAPLWIMGQGVSWIGSVAAFVADLPGAASLVKSGPVAALGLMTFGGLILILIRGAWRFAGGVCATIAVALWAVAPRPYILISADRGLVGVLTPEGRALSRDRGGSYAAKQWLRRDGNPADQAAANALWPEAQAARGWSMAHFPDGTRILHHFGKVKGDMPDCTDGMIWITRQPLPVHQGCHIIGAEPEAPLTFDDRGVYQAPPRIWSPITRAHNHARD